MSQDGFPLPDQPGQHIDVMQDVVARSSGLLLLRQTVAGTSPVSAELRQHGHDPATLKPHLDEADSSLSKNHRNRFTVAITAAASSLLSMTVGGFLEAAGEDIYDLTKEALVAAADTQAGALAADLLELVDQVTGLDNNSQADDDSIEVTALANYLTKLQEPDIELATDPESVQLAVYAEIAKYNLINDALIELLKVRGLSSDKIQGEQQNLKQVLDQKITEIRRYGVLTLSAERRRNLSGGPDLQGLSGKSPTYLKNTYEHLSGANLREAKLSHADLKNVNLAGADLTRADLSNANLGRANLNWANLLGADLTGSGPLKRQPHQRDAHRGEPHQGVTLLHEPLRGRPHRSEPLRGTPRRCEPHSGGSQLDRPQAWGPGRRPHRSEPHRGGPH